MWYVYQKNCRVVSLDGAALTNMDRIKETEKYMYLGILKYDKIKESEMKVRFMFEYLRRIKLIMERRINRKSNRRLMDTWAVYLMRDTVIVFRWKREHK